MMNRLLTGLGLALTLLSAAALAAPVGYTVNSDSGEDDSLYTIDLANADTTLVGPVLLPQSDIEGLAFDGNGDLYALDDENIQLFRLNPQTGAPDLPSRRVINGLTPASNDFGMTFSCSGTLYATSRADQGLYEIDPESGLATRIGDLGSDIIAMTSRGPDDALWGVSSGESDTAAGSGRRLFRIDPASGATSEIGFLETGPYREAGLGFDADGNLWMITDRVGVDGSSEFLDSQIWQINPDSAAVTFNGTTSIQGAESLAVASPAGCQVAPPPPPPGDDNAVPVPTLSLYNLALLLGLMLMMGSCLLTRRL